MERRRRFPILIHVLSEEETERNIFCDFFTTYFLYPEVAFCRNRKSRAGCAVLLPVVSETQVVLFLLFDTLRVVFGEHDVLWAGGVVVLFSLSFF